MTYALPEALNWFGWAALGALVGGFALLWRWHRRRKARTRLEPDPPVCALPAFPSVHGRVETPQETVDKWAGRLRSIYMVAWPSFAKIYLVQEALRPIPIEKVFLHVGPVDDDRRPILWRAPHGRVDAQMQEALPYWWACELHNIFRFAYFGMEAIYDERDPDDLMRMNMAVEWINRCYKQRAQGGGEVTSVGS